MPVIMHRNKEKNITRACLLLCLLTVLWGCNSFFYFPSDNTYGDGIPESHEEFFIKSRSGNSLNLLYFRAEKPRGLILHFHGNARNISAHYRAFLWAVEAGYDLIVWDYSGYGKSTGLARRDTVYLDSISMLDFAADRKAENRYPLIVAGQALGGAVLLGALGGFERMKEVDFIIVDCTFPSYVDVGAYHINDYTCLPLSLGGLLISDEYAPWKSYGAIKDLPVLVAHCREDQVVPFFLGQKLFRNLQNRDKTFWEMSCRHTAGFWKKENQRRLLAFLEEKISGRKNQKEMESPPVR
jgi:fermentation-respiration switch protein FrsA (DUF1100 family)